MRLQSYLEKQGEENSRRPFGGAGVRGSQFVVQLGVVQLRQEQNADAVLTGKQFNRAIRKLPKDPEGVK